MKKSLLISLVGSALTAVLPAQANAAVFAPIESNITGFQLWMWDANLLTAETPTGYFTGFAFGGIAYDLDDDGHIDSSNLTFHGETGFTAAALNIRITFNLSQGDYAQNSGITFSAGTIDTEVQQDDGSWFLYSSMDAAANHVAFLSNQPGHTGLPGQTTAGIVSDALPGLWDGVIGSSSFNRAATVLDWGGATVGLFLEGTLATMPPLDPHDGEATGLLHFDAPAVPVPAAAWLFGSGLAGLAAMGRRRA